MQSNTNRIQLETSEKVEQTEEKVVQQEKLEETKEEVFETPVEVNEDQLEDKSVAQENTANPVKQESIQHQEQKTNKPSANNENTKEE